MGRCRVVGVAVALLLAPTACGDDDEGGGTTATAGDRSTTTTESDATTTTATTATTTFAQADDPPPLVNTGEDFDAIVRSFVAYGSWLGAHPNVDALGEIVRRDGPLWQQTEPALSGLIGDGLRDSGEAPARVVETRVLERPSPDVAIIYAVIDNPGYRILTSDGATAHQVPAEPRTAWAYELRRSGDRWLIENRTSLGEV